jgi:phosphoserine phosphatase
MDNVLTLVSADHHPLEQPLVARLCDRLAAAGAEIHDQKWLTKDKAVDLFFANLPLQSADHLARKLLASAPIDLLTQPTQGRRKKLFLADMDSTIVEGETLDDLAALAGLGPEIAAITARAMNGEIQFVDALRERVAMLRGLDASCLEETARSMRLNPGAGVLVRTLSSAGVYTALVSGGFTYFTDRVARQLGFDSNQGNRIEIVDNRLTGQVTGSIVTKDTKLKTLQRLASELDISVQEALTVGDGANDLPMLQAAGLGVAYYAKPVVVAEAKAQVTHTDLTTLLYYQGYADSEFVTGRPTGSAALCCSQACLCVRTFRSGWRQIATRLDLQAKAERISVPAFWHRLF